MKDPREDSLVFIKREDSLVFIKLACEAFGKFLETVSTLRSPDGCPWDREQTPSSMRYHLVEETYEIIEAIDENDAEHVREEVGDVLLILSMLTLMYTEKDSFGMKEVLDDINAKLIRRHPHVFGDVKVNNAEEALHSWKTIKADVEGRTQQADSVLDGIHPSLPPLERAIKLHSRAAKSGLKNDDAAIQVKEFLDKFDAVHKDAHKEIGQDEQEEAAGEILFSLIGAMGSLGVNSSLALRKANARFEKNFRQKEQQESDSP